MGSKQFYDSHLLHEIQKLRESDSSQEIIFNVQDDDHFNAQQNTEFYRFS